MTQRDPNEPSAGGPFAGDQASDRPPTESAVEPVGDAGAAHPALGSRAARPGVESDHQALTYSKDYWDIVFEQLGHRALFKVGMVILTILYGTAVFAPLLANDEPYLLEAVDLGRYEGAVRLLSPTASSAGRLVETTDEEYAESIEEREDAEPTRGAAFAAEWAAARLRVDVMRRYLPPEEHDPVDEYATLFEDGAEAFGVGDEAVTPSGVASGWTWDGPVDEAAALEKIDAAKQLARTMRREMGPWNPAEPEREGVDLIGQRSWPLLASLRTWEVWLMALWLLWATWPVWNRVLNRAVLGGNRGAIRRWRRRKVLGMLAMSVLAAVVWRGVAGPVPEDIGVASEKRALTDGSMVLVAAGHTLRERAEHPGRAVWAPVPYGYAETHTVEKYRWPTWLPESAIDPETGYYTYGELAPEADDVTGDLQGPVPLEVRAGEPGPNDWDRHIAGTDELGRDFFGRMLWGARVSLAVGILSSALLTVIGVFFGALAGFFGGWVDVAIMRLIEILQSIPAFFLILLAVAFTDPEVVSPIVAIIVVIAIVRWTGIARLVRGEFLRLRDQEFVVAARALGFSSARTIFRHVLPNAMSPVLVAAAFSVAAGILTESAVSFLGFGIRPPDASWGSLVNESKNPTHWWIQVFPGVLIFVTVTCYNLVGDAIRDALDPKMKV